MYAKMIMVQGTASDVGKSVFVTALCRIFRQRGFKVAPFKAQNMANNSFVTSDGGEIGRAQAVQAEACKINPTVDMNPVLLKPTSERKSQVIVLGKPVKTLQAREYQEYKKGLKPIVHASLHRLREQFDIVVLEGAGSPAEINMKENDLVNMSIAAEFQCPVILIADIDKGGVFAQIIGTYTLLEKKEQDLLSAFVINKFRGDEKILQPGIDWIEKKIGKKSLGVLPMIQDLRIEQEDSVYLDKNFAKSNEVKTNTILVHVIKLPRISNYTDFEPLKESEGVALKYVEKPDRHTFPDLLILPGTKSTIEDLLFLQNVGWDDYIRRAVRLGIVILGVCGGYQMLGEEIIDADGVEGKRGIYKGLGLLPLKTTFLSQKTTVAVQAIDCEENIPLQGYEIHMGISEFTQKDVCHLFKIVQTQEEKAERFDGLQQNNIMGTYIHGLFDTPKYRNFFIRKLRTQLGMKICEESTLQGKQSHRDKYDDLASEVEKYLDMDALMKILNGKGR